MNEGRRRPGFVGPLILITIGIFLLLQQMGRLPWEIWLVLWRFWPVIFILIGLDILVSTSRSTAVYLAGLLVAILVIGGLIVYTVYQGGQLLPTGARARGTETIVEALQDASDGRVTLQPGVARTEIGALSDSPNFVEGEIEYGSYSLQVEKNFTVRNGQAVLVLRSRSESIPFWAPGESSTEHWNLKFTPRIPLQIEVDTGVGKVMMDLSKLRVTQLDVKAGVGETLITFPAAAGHTKSSIKAGVGSVSVRIAEGVGARVHVSKGLGSVNVNNRRLTRSGDDYVSSDYNTAENKLDLDISGGIGSITIE